MVGRPGRAGLMAAFLVLAMAPAVAAQENPEYEEVAAKARSAFENGRFGEAADLFQEAFDIDPRGNLLYNIGFCYEKSGDLLQAVTFYSRFIQAVPGSPKRPAIQRKIAELQAQLGDQYEDVSVSSEPSGAVIFVDDKARGAMGVAPLTFKLLPGNYTFIGELKGYETAKKQVEVIRGAPAIVDLTLVDSANVGTVDLRVSERDANVMIDGRKVGTSPLKEPLRLRRGSHEVIIMKPGFTTWRRDIDVRAGGATKSQADLVEEGGEDPSGGGGGGGDRLWAYVTLGAGVALIGGGVVTGLSAKGLYDDLSSQKDEGKRVTRSQADDGNSKVLMTNLLFGAGAAAVVGGAVWWWLAGRRGGVDTAGDVRAGAAVMPGGGVAFQVGGRF